jgi:hypothetical protein
MAEAVRAYARYLQSDDRWMLGRFVVPAARLDELDAAASALTADGPADMPWRISAIVGANLASDGDAIARFNARSMSSPTAPARISTAKVDTIEIRVGSVDEVARLAARMPLVERLWFEVSLGPALPAILDAIATMQAGAKLRTGGLTEDAIPRSDAVARFLLGCARAGVPYKATAGLHHATRGRYPLTYEQGSPSATMHGFLNLFLAGVLAHQLWKQGVGNAEALAAVTALLDEEHDTAFLWRADSVEWRGFEFSLGEIEQVREQGPRSFGSCSFEEPVATVRAAIGAACITR